MVVVAIKKERHNFCPPLFSQGTAAAAASSQNAFLKELGQFLVFNAVFVVPAAAAGEKKFVLQKWRLVTTDLGPEFCLSSLF